METVDLPPDEVLFEQAYLVARGVRPLSLAGHVHVDDESSLLAIATRIERFAQTSVVPFVVDHGDRVASFGYASTRWVVDLYEWAVRDPAVPEEHEHRIVGLLLGYGAPAVARYEEEGSGRRFATASAAPAAS